MMPGHPPLAAGGERAWQRSANLEAISHLTRARDASGSTRHHGARPAGVGLADCPRASLHRHRGPGGSEVGHTYSRARELCGRWGRRRSSSGPCGDCGIFMWYGQSYRPRGSGVRNSSPSPNTSTTRCIFKVHFTLGSTCSTWGFPRSREQWAQSLASRLPAAPRTRGPFRLGPRGVWPSPAPHALWSLSCPDQARHESREALTLAQVIPQPRGGAGLCSHAPSVPPGAARPRARRSRHSALYRAGFAYYLAWGMTMQGWAQVVQDQNQEGMAQIRRGLPYGPRGPHCACRIIWPCLPRRVDRLVRRRKG